MTDNIDEIVALAEAYSLNMPAAPAAIGAPKGVQIAGWIDHTLLKPEATPTQVTKLCQEALAYGFAGVCVQPTYLSLVARLLQGSQVKPCTVVGFPLGANTSAVKAFEALDCLEAGAGELDMVLNIGALKAGAYGQVLDDVRMVCELAHPRRVTVKVILEMCLLTQPEKILACLLCRAAGVDYVKTSTGFSTGGATVDDVQLMYRVVGPQIKVKAAGGIRTYSDALAMIAAGASRLGTSAGVQIMQEAGAG